MQPERYVAAIDVHDNAVSITLRPEGLALGRYRDGSHELAAYVRSLDGWRGNRGEANLASEIRAHCLAWSWLPPLRRRANPIDLEFDQPWPVSLILGLKRYVFSRGRDSSR